MPSICFVSFYSGQILLSREQQIAGGAEVQQHLLAQALHQTGMRVSFVIGDEAGTGPLEHEEYSVYRSYDRARGIRFIKYFYPQFFKVWRALKNANCDYYYVRGMRVESGITWLFCLLHRRKYIAAIAANRECTATTLPSSRWNPKSILFIIALKRAHWVFAQTSWQKATLREEFGVDATIVRNAMPVDSRKSLATGSLKQVLWVGTVVPDKRPEIYLRLASLFPGIHFTLIGPLRYGLEEYRETIKNQASEIANVTYIDSVNFDEIHEYYFNADLFILTSADEGFPNVLLQAWASGTAVLTSFDPDSIVAKYKLGYIADIEADFQRHISRLVAAGSASSLKEAGERGRAYVKKFHSPSAIAGEIRNALGITDTHE